MRYRASQSSLEKNFQLIFVSLKWRTFALMVPYYFLAPFQWLFKQDIANDWQTLDGQINAQFGVVGKLYGDHSDGVVM